MESVEERGSLGVVHGAALYVGALIGPGVLLVPALAVQAAGAASIVAYAALLVLSAPLAITFAALGVRHPVAGGVTAYVREGFGDTAAAVTGGWFLAAVCLGVLGLGLRARRTPRIPQLAYLVVVGFLLVNKVYSPQYVLWLLPLAVLARPRWRDVLIWTAGELFYFGAVWLYLGGWTASASAGVPDQLYAFAILVRMAAEVYLAVMVVRDIVQPWRDPVRADGLTDDPAEPTAVPA